MVKYFISIFLQIEVRKCVVYNEAIGRYGAWDGDKCTTVMSEQVSTVCECYTDGTFGKFNFQEPIIHWKFADEYTSYIYIYQY